MFHYGDSGVRAVAEAGYMVSTSTDMAKWLLFLLSKGKGPDGNQLVDADALSRTFQSENVVDRAESILQPSSSLIQYAPFDTYALGWFLGHYKGK